MRCGGFFAVSGASGSQRAIATHGIANDCDIFFVNEAVEEMIGAMGEFFDSRDGEELITGAVEEGALKTFFGAGNGVGVVDGGDDVALGGEVFGEVAEEKARSGKTVRNDDQRKGFSRRGRRATKRFAGEGEGFGTGVVRRRTSRHGHYIPRALFGVGGDGGGIPDFDGQGAIVERNFAGGFIEIENVGLGGILEFDGPDADGVGTAWCEFGSVDERDAEENVGGGRLGRTVCGEKQKGGKEVGPSHARNLPR